MSTLAEAQTHAQVLAAQAGGFGTTGLSAWIQNNVITIILLLIAATALWAGKNGNISKVVTIGACAVVGVAILALATTGAAADIGVWIVGLFRA